MIITRSKKVLGKDGVVYDATSGLNYGDVVCIPVVGTQDKQNYIKLTKVIGNPYDDNYLMEDSSVILKAENFSMDRKKMIYRGYLPTKTIRTAKMVDSRMALVEQNISEMVAYDINLQEIIDMAFYNTLVETYNKVSDYNLQSKKTLSPSECIFDFVSLFKAGINPFYNKKTSDGMTPRFYKQEYINSVQSAALASFTKGICLTALRDEEGDLDRGLLTEFDLMLKSIDNSVKSYERRERQ